MRILFAYFDFKADKDQLISPHLREDCSLNFSTEHNYSVTKEKVTTESGKIVQYTIAQKPKPESECLPKDFWGERIYNVTAIVGDNGSGKSTILHSLIRSVIRGLDPGVPFLLILQKSESEELQLYCSHGNNYTWIGTDSLFPQYEYPWELMKAKSMLLDNTLSFSSYGLTREYDRMSQNYKPKKGPYCEWQKQFYNKSLFASVQFSNDMSKYDLRTEINPVSSMMSIHFSYESFQEIRFLFDRNHLEVLEELEKQGYPVPRTKHLTVSVQDPMELFREQFKLEDNLYSILSPFFNRFYKLDFPYQIAIDAVINLMCYTDILFGKTKWNYPYEVVDECFSNKQMATAEEIARAAAVFIDRINVHYADDTLQKMLSFFQYIMSKAKTLSRLFPTAISKEARYEIDVEEIASKPRKCQNMVDFLEKYRADCDPRYYLMFFSGMSSGEKNLLRMLTQFRYMLRGPVDYKGRKKGVYLQNKYNEEELFCDTLFLFLDEVDLTYHVEWQRIIIAMLTTVLPRMFREKYFEEGKKGPGCCDIQVILATHSPLMLGDFPKSSIIYLPDPKSDNQTIVPKSSFGENLYTILKDGFFMKDTVGEIAKRKINAAARWCADVKRRERLSTDDKWKKEDETLSWKEEYEIHRKTAQLLSPGIIRNKLLQELNDCAYLIGIKELNDMQNDPEKLKLRIKELEIKLNMAEKKLAKAGIAE